MILLSITGLLRTLLIILGILFLMSIIGKMAQARRNVAEDRRTKSEDEANRQMVEEAKKNYGKTTISNKKSNTEFTDFEEVD